MTVIILVMSCSLSFLQSTSSQLASINLNQAQRRFTINNRGNIVFGTISINQAVPSSTDTLATYAQNLASSQVLMSTNNQLLTSPPNYQCVCSNNQIPKENSYQFWPTYLSNSGKYVNNLGSLPIDKNFVYTNIHRQDTSKNVLDTNTRSISVSVSQIPNKLSNSFKPATNADNILPRSNIFTLNPADILPSSRKLRSNPDTSNWPTNSASVGTSNGQILYKLPNKFDISIMADSLQICGNVTISGRMPLLGSVEVNGTIACNGTGSVNYSGDTP